MNRLLLALFAFILLFGCPKPDEEKVGFAFSYRLILDDGTVSEGAVVDSVTVPRSAVYFHLRANITNNGEATQLLRVLDQRAGAYETTLPLYSVERINGFGRDWESIGWAEALGIGPVSNEKERTIEFHPGEGKPVEAPLFFFNANTSSGLPLKNELEISIVNANGTVLGTKKVNIFITD